MAEALEPRTIAAGDVSFEVERFAFAGERLELDGRWFGVRGRRFIRPALTIAPGNRVLAELEHKPWAPEDGELWRAAFPVEDADAVQLPEVELAVGNDVAIKLPAPAGASGPRGAGRRAVKQPGRPPAGRRAAAELDAARAELEAIAAERDALAAERDAAAAERDVAIAGRDEALADRRRLVRDRRALLAERDRALADLEAARAGLAAGGPPPPPAPTPLERVGAPAAPPRDPADMPPALQPDVGWARRGLAILLIIVALIAFAVVVRLV